MSYTKVAVASEIADNDARTIAVFKSGIIQANGYTEGALNQIKNTTHTKGFEE